MQRQLDPDILPDMEDTSLYSSLWPTPGNRQQYAFLAVTDDYRWSWQLLEELFPGIARLPACPMPTNNILGCPGNEADQAANSNTIQQDNGIDLTG